MKFIVNNKGLQNLAWILMLLISYSIIDYYVNYLLSSLDGELGFVSHFLALFAVLVLAFGIFSGRKVRK